MFGRCHGKAKWKRKDEKIWANTFQPKAADRISHILRCRTGGLSSSQATTAPLRTTAATTTRYGEHTFSRLDGRPWQMHIIQTEGLVRATLALFRHSTGLDWGFFFSNRADHISAEDLPV